MSRKCPCHGCKDRNATCHTTKGNCPHDFKGWLKEHEAQRDEANKQKAVKAVSWTDAQIKRHINFIKHGPGNSKR